ncbi:MAG: hypothetical protein IIA83_04515 [Thaumarchaeota archaeon]|nr:hypothetical protein [Nitrososphaerota archaeon]
MKQTQLALSAVMIVVVGLVGANFVTGLEMTSDNGMNAFVGSSPIYGHVTVIHSDPSGQILSYSQGDNVVTREGKDCIVERLFGVSDAADCNATSTTDLFSIIGLATGLEEPTLATNATLANGLNARDYADSGLDPQIATGFVFTPAAGVNGAKMDITKTFTATDDTNPVDEAILYNADQTAVFAAQKFTSVTLNTDDTLAITWSITLG